MTLKEKMREIMPSVIDDMCDGGIRGCPSDYDFLTGHYEKNVCCRRANYNCERCWSLEYIENDGVRQGE